MRNSGMRVPGLLRFVVLSIVLVFSISACAEDSATTSAAYGERLRSAEKLYPFEEWKTYYPGLDQYTVENCDAAANIFDTLLAELAAAGPYATETAKLEHFRRAVLDLNKLNYETFLIETWEREQLAALIDEITRLVGLEPKDYARGAGIADLWREW